MPLHAQQHPDALHTFTTTNTRHHTIQPHTLHKKREEEFFDREAVLGRDAASVFPKEAAAAAAAGRSAMVEALGARKFISETEVGGLFNVCWCLCACVDLSLSKSGDRGDPSLSERAYTRRKHNNTLTPSLLSPTPQLAEIKAARGGTADDGGAAADKPLAEILAERKAEKDAAFQERWRQMKTGKNRPLDADEAGFFADLRRLEAERAAAAADEERSELEAFRAAVRAAAAGGGGGGGAEGGSADGTAGGGGGREEQQQQPAAAPARQGSGPVAAAVAGVKKAPAVVLKPAVRVIAKPKRPAASGGGGKEEGGSGKEGGGGDEEGGCKRQRTAADKDGGSESDGGSGGGGGLAGLLGGYGSGSDND